MGTKQKYSSIRSVPSTTGQSHLKKGHEKQITPLLKNFTNHLATLVRFEPRTSGI